MTTLPDEIVDAHHHLWDLEAVHYPWLMAKGVTRFFGDPTPIQKNYLPVDLRCDAGDLNIVGSVHVQVGAAPDATLTETRWLHGQATETGLPSAIVAFADLRRDDLANELARHTAFPSFRGVRQIVGRHPGEDAALGTDTLIKDPRWLLGLRVLETLGLSFDLQLIAGQYERVARVLTEVPDLKVAICHFGSPWEQDAASFDHWAQSMARYAELPNVYFKFSGFAMFDAGWTVETLRPYVETALALFGPSRCMVGSNYPVDGLRRPYRDVFDAVSSLTGGLGTEARADIFADTARRFYRFRGADPKPGL